MAQASYRVPQAFSTIAKQSGSLHACAQMTSKIGAKAAGMSATDVFYDTSSLTHAELEALLLKAHSVCENWWMDKLDCTVSFARQRVPDVSFEDAMRHFRPGAFFSVIHRKQIVAAYGPHLEVGFSSMEHPVDYFLWIIVPLDRAPEIVDGLPVRS